MRRVQIASLSLLVALGAACGGVRKRGASASGSSRSGKITLAVLPTESDKFPTAAKAITGALADATIAGVDDKQVASVSLEVAQLSIECVEPTLVCYTKVGRSLSANRLLWAEIKAEDKKRLKVTVTLFDVDARKPHSARRVFANEKEASAKIGELVSEVSR